MPYVQPYIQAQLGSTVFCMMETLSCGLDSSSVMGGLHIWEPP